MKHPNINFNKNIPTRSQIEIIKNEKYPIYVKASAGTGKTETLIQKIVYILQHDSSASLSNMLVISFTNKSTNEIRNRLEDLLYYKSLCFKKLGNIDLYSKFKEQAYSVNISHISTIHSFCEDILRRYGLEISCSPNYVISSYSNKTKEIIKEVTRLFYKNNDIPEISEDIMSSLIFEIYKNNCNKGIYTVNNCYKNVFTPLGMLRKKFIDIYNQAVLEIDVQKSADNVVTLNDLIEKVTTLIKNEKIKSRIVQKFKYIFIDEYQDTNMSQFNITKMFINMGIKVFLVGDDEQSIYGFRGSDIESSTNMNKYISSLKDDKKDLSLVENFRSDPKIIKIINHIFSSPFTYNHDKLNFNHIPLIVSNVNNQSEEVPSILYDDSNIVDIVQDIISNQTIRGRPIGYSDIAILCRKNYMIDKISELFKNVGIPVEVIGGHGFYRVKEIVDIYKYLNYIVYRKEEYKKELIFSDIYKSISIYKRISFNKFLNDLCNIAQGSSMGIVFDFLIENSNIYDYYTQIGYYQAIANIEKLKMMSYVDTDLRYMSAIEFLEFITDKIIRGTEEDEATVSDINREKGVVSIYTVHKSKGLSFPIVIISNMDERLINYKKLPKIIMKCKDGKVGLGFSKELINKEDIQYKKLIDQHIDVVSS